MTEKILETIIATFTKELISESKDIFSDFYDEGKHFIGTQLKNYLTKQKTKYSHIKTLLKGNTPVYLYEIYYPINLLTHETLVLTENISNIFVKSNYITIIGDAGSGKSTLTKHLFLNSIKEKFGIPILVELRYLNETDGDIERFIIEVIFENKLSENPKILERLLNKGKFVFFLDGFDELNIEIKNQIIKNLNSFINKFDKNKYILTSRPYSNIENLPLFQNFKIKELDNEKGEIDGFIDLQLRKEKELAEKIKKSLRENKSEYIQSFLTNPLLLTLYILTFQTNAEIPNKKFIFYRRVINALFSEHDSKTKLGYIREKQSKLTQEQFEEILKAFCFLSYFEGRYDFDYDYINKILKSVKSKINKFDFDNNKFIYDLKSAISLWTEDNGIYGFAHRSLQEYLAALFIKNLNPVDNERAYKKIIEKVCEKRRASEVENFLSLCHEMDEVNFSKFYYLPLLEEINSLLNFENDNSLIKSFVLFFSDGLICNNDNANRHQQVSVKDSVYKTIYIHLPYTRKLYHLLKAIAENKIICNHKTLCNQKQKPGKILKFNNDIPVEVFEIISANNDIKKLSIDFHLFITEKINQTKKLIEQAITTDKELLDMI
jgi:hypothetical protein